jgi:hypothetical protein
MRSLQNVGPIRSEMFILLTLPASKQLQLRKAQLEQRREVLKEARIQLQENNAIETERALIVIAER